MHTCLNNCIFLCFKIHSECVIMNLTLCGSEVREILVVCCEHASQIDAYLARSKWNSEAAKGRNVLITTVHGIDCWACVLNSEAGKCASYS